MLLKYSLQRVYKNKFIKSNLRKFFKQTTQFCYLKLVQKKVKYFTYNYISSIIASKYLTIVSTRLL